MVNSRRKGKKSELYFVNRLKEIFPDVHREWKSQTAVGGVDLANTVPFDIEIKSGKSTTLETIRKWLEQVEDEGNPNYFKVVLAKPDKKGGKGKKFEPYVVMPFSDWAEILEMLKGALGGSF